MSQQIQHPDSDERLHLETGVKALQSSAEFRGPGEPLDSHNCNDHFALIYERREEKLDAIGPFLGQGLERGERCMCVLDQLTEEEVTGAIRRAGVDVEAAIESGALTFHTVEETYLGDGSFDPDEMIDLYVEYIEEALDEYAGFRVAAETTWLQEKAITVDQFMEYEAKINGLFDDRDCLALCMYDRAAFAPETVRDIIRTHPNLIYDGTVCNNLYYTPPEEYFDKNSARSDVEQMLGTLVERTAAKLALHERERFLTELYETTASPHLTFNEKVREILALGQEWFDLDIGYFAEVDVEADEFEVVEAVGSHPEIQPDVSGPLDESYCIKVIEAERPVSVVNAVAEGWEEDDAYDTYSLDAYVGTALDVDGEVYGTLCFGSETPRDSEFSDVEYAFLELMGQWISHELERSERERQLERYREYTGEILDSLDDLFYVVDETGKLRRWNETFVTVTGYTDEEIAAMHSLDFFDESDHEVVTSAIADVLEHGDACIETELQTKNGDRIPYEFVVVALETPSDEQVIAGIGRDIAERKTQERFQRELYEVTSDSDTGFDEKMEKVLRLGCERFGPDQGYLTSFHHDEEVIGYEYAVGLGDQAPETGIPDIQAEPGQFCRSALETDEPVGIPDVAQHGWDDGQLYRESGIRSYFGVKTSDGTTPYGTLAFCGTETREDPFSEAERTALELMGQWVSHALEQNRREEQLAALNRMSRELMNAETPAEITNITVEHAHESLQLPLTAVIEYDDETGRLVPGAVTPRAEDVLPTATLCERTDGPVWRAFVENEATVVDAPADDCTLPDDRLSSLVAIPLGHQGVFVTGTVSNEFNSADLDFVETTAATIETAFTRVDREQLLHERETTLKTQNESLERLNRINTTIRNIHRKLVQAGTRGEIEKLVCEQLANVGPYELAWIGEQEPVTGEVVPHEQAGADNGYLDEIRITVSDEPTGRGPGGRTLKSRETQVVNDILNDDSFRPWRQAALNRGYHSVISLPLEYDDTLYGILLVYAGEPGVFDDLERAVLTEMADTIAYAINAVESKKALVSNEITELELTVENTELGMLQLARTVGCECQREALIPQSDGGLRCLFSTRGVSAKEILAVTPQLPVTDLRVLSERTEDDERVCLFDAELGSNSVFATVLEHGGQLAELHADEEAARVAVHLAGDADAREFVEMFRTKYPGATLTAQRTRQRRAETIQEFRSTVIEELTSRQLEVLQTAYFNGYFEEPRAQSAREIADTLDITQPTFNSHVRSAQRKLYRYLFDEEPLGV